jgi:D-alanyl-D-alanine carboxypeptidase
VAGGIGQTVPLCVTSPDVTVQNGEEHHIEVKIDLPSFLWAPVTAGERVGSVTYQIGKTREITVPVTVGDSVQARPSYSFFKRWLRNFQKLVYTV